MSSSCRLNSSWCPLRLPQSSRWSALIVSPIELRLTEFSPCLADQKNLHPWRGTVSVYHTLQWVILFTVSVYYLTNFFSWAWLITRFLSTICHNVSLNTWNTSPLSTKYVLNAPPSFAWCHITCYWICLHWRLAMPFTSNDLIYCFRESWVSFGEYTSPYTDLSFLTDQEPIHWVESWIDWNKVNSQQEVATLDLEFDNPRQ